MEEVRYGRIPCSVVARECSNRDVHSPNRMVASWTWLDCLTSCPGSEGILLRPYGTRWRQEEDLCLASDRWAETRFSSGLPLDSRSAAVTRRIVKRKKTCYCCCCWWHCLRPGQNNVRDPMQSLSSVSLARTSRLNVLKDFSFSLSLSLF